MVQVHFELFVRRNKASSWALELASEDRLKVVETAEDMLRDKSVIAVRVTKEVFDPARGAFDSFVILKRGDDTLRSTSKPPSDPAPLCTGPPDLYTLHAREQIGRLLDDWLRRRRVTPFELLHRTDLAEQLDAGMDLQHAIQKISVPEAQARSVTPHEVMRHYRKLADAAVARLAAATRRGFADLSSQDFGETVARLRAHGEGAFLLSGALAAHLAPCRTWSEKVDRLLTLAEAAPEPGRAFALSVLVQPLAEILGSRAGLAEFGAEGLDLGGHLALLTRLVACAEVDRMVAIDPSLAAEFPPLTPQILRLSRWLQDPAFAPVRAALARRILVELNGPRRLRPADPQGEIAILRALAMVLTAFAGQVLTAEDVHDAFVDRSRNLMSPDFVASFIGGDSTPLQEVQALIRLTENLAGAANKRTAAKWILGSVGALKFGRHLRQHGEPGRDLCALAELRRGMERVGLAPADQAAIAERLGVVAGLIDDDVRYVARIAKSPASPAQRVTRLLSLAKGQTAPPGPVSARAQVEIDKLLRTPELRAELAARAAPPP
ncbi:MAG: hypothetical protein ACYDD1_01870 [Caulobacteraceae bacterium]